MIVGSRLHPHGAVLQPHRYAHVESTQIELGYRQWKGFRTTAEQVWELFEGLQISGLDNFQYLLTGYIADAATVAIVGKIGKILKEKDPKLIWGIILDVLNLTQ
jgi:hypothetical protein